MASAALRREARVLMVALMVALTGVQFAVGSCAGVRGGSLTFFSMELS